MLAVEENEASSPTIRSAGAAHADKAEAVLADLRVDASRGLGSERARKALISIGPNELPQPPREPWWRALHAQVQDIAILLLLAAAIVAGALREWIDVGAIVAIVVLNAALGLFQQRKAEKTLEALRRLSAPFAKVRRDGDVISVPARELVPGDIVELEAGDHVPADLRLVRSFRLQVREAALTGESTPTEKEADAVLPADASLGDRRNMAYLGTDVTAGKATGLVVATGSGTELGKIAGLLASGSPQPTPLQRRLAELSKALAVVCLALVGVVFVMQLVRGEAFADVVRMSVSLAVAAIPEGLPAVITITLALGLQRMAARRALVRRLAAVETLGSVTVICSDKTGTLTRNEMTVREAWIGGRTHRASGAGYAPEGRFHTEGESGGPLEDLRHALAIGVRCNHATLSRNEAGEWTALGDPTEAALLTAAAKARVQIRPKGVETLHEIPFDSSRKRMAVIAREADGSTWMCVKGAPEMVLSLCTHQCLDGMVVPLTDADRHAIADAAARMAARALRVLALAFKPGEGEEAAAMDESDLTFAGLVGMIDPPREEAKIAVQRCREAGIRPVMITGDHPATAQAIAAELGILRAGERVVAGKELTQMSDETLERDAGWISVYARVSAEDKLRVVRALQRKGAVAAMTGDGVNDAPAVQAADIGVAMGVTGTDVTKQASAMVLLDDNFATIVNAVEEGRAIFANIQRFVHYLLAGNAGLIFLFFVAAALGWPTPLLPLQVLWINLVTNGLPALALGLEAAHPNLMRRRPRDPSAPVIDRRRAGAILLHGGIVGSAAIAGFYVFLHRPEATLAQAQLAAFCIMSLGHLFFAFACRNEQQPIFSLGLFSNKHLILAAAVSLGLQLAVLCIPGVREAFGATSGFDATTIAMIAAFSLAPVLTIEAVKSVRWTLSRHRA